MIQARANMTLKVNNLQFYESSDSYEDGDSENLADDEDSQRTRD